ncbi:MAG: T9SS type A sorting domain-containing protein [Chitinophagales bacterium]
MFPNPNNGIFTFSWQNISAISDYELYIADIYGKEIFRYKGNNVRLPINLTTFPSGIYFLQVQQNEQVWASKVAVH